MDPPPLPRDQFPVTDQLTYLNHAGVAPLPRATVEAQAAADNAWMTEGGRAFGRYEDHVEHVRARAAQLMGVHATEVAIVKNTTEGLGFVANGLDWSPGDRVIVPAREFPSTILPFLGLENLGVEVVRLEPEGDTEALPLERFETELRAAPTRLVTTSWVQYRRGWRTDLAELATLCHEHGALLCADVIQGLGLLPTHLDEWGVDFAMADAHKWMLGPQGCGVLFVATAHRDDLRVLEPGWNSVADRDDFDRLELDLDPSARRFEGGTHNYTAVAGMGAAIDLLLDAGPERVWTHVDHLCDQATAALTEAGATVWSDRGAARSGILTFGVSDRDPGEVHDHLESAGVVSAPRAGGIRISPHGYNTTDDLEHLISALRELT